MGSPVRARLTPRPHHQGLAVQTASCSTTSRIPAPETRNSCSITAERFICSGTGAPLPSEGALDLEPRVPGVLKGWVRSLDGRWWGLVDLRLMWANRDPLVGFELTDQFVPASALSPATTAQRDGPEGTATLCPGKRGGSVRNAAAGTVPIARCGESPPGLGPSPPVWGQEVLCRSSSLQRTGSGVGDHDSLSILTCEPRHAVDHALHQCNRAVRATDFDRDRPSRGEQVRA
jgi:hypothetical protein